MFALSPVQEAKTVDSNQVVFRVSREPIAHFVAEYSVIESELKRNPVNLDKLSFMQHQLNSSARAKVRPNVSN